ncbi:siderophore-interacting protein [Gulosibacter sp. GYB002]|uniref:siderophore-interacting protein n=1 Tax=Gulosibacter sp. GYB002 TaxID=2994391 RepID=UPI002F96B998
MIQLPTPKTDKQRFEMRRRSVTLDSIEHRGPQLVRCWFSGDLEDFVSPNSGDHVKLQVPNGDGNLVAPRIDPETGRPANRAELGLRDMTPRKVEGGRVAIDIVRHSGGVIGSWLEHASVGDRCAFHGPRGTKTIVEPLDELIAVVDLTALPAAERRFTELGIPGKLHLIGEGVDELELPNNVAVTATPYDVEWREVIPGVLDDIPPTGAVLVWGAGEARGVSELRAALRQRVRSGLFGAFNGYWQRGIAEFDHHAELPQPATH